MATTLVAHPPPVLALTTLRFRRAPGEPRGDGPLVAQRRPDGRHEVAGRGDLRDVAQGACGAPALDERGVVVDRDEDDPSFGVPPQQLDRRVDPAAVCGITMSLTIRSGRAVSAAATSASPSATVATTSSSRSSSARNSAAITGLSSARSTRGRIPDVSTLKRLSAVNHRASCSASGASGARAPQWPGWPPDPTARPPLASRGGQRGCSASPSSARSARASPAPPSDRRRGHGSRGHTRPAGHARLPVVVGVDRLGVAIGMILDGEVRLIFTGSAASLTLAVSPLSPDQSRRINQQPTGRRTGSWRRTGS
jgi:hypothetical protein